MRNWVHCWGILFPNSCKYPKPNYKTKRNNHSSLVAINNLTTDLPQRLDISKRLLSELSGWQQAFSNQPQEPLEDTASLTTVCTLGHHYVQMTIYRAIIGPFVANSNSEMTNDTGQLAREQQEILSFARCGVRSATISAANFVKSLKDEHFHMFWPHWSQVAFSSICFLNLMMAMSSLDTQEAAAWFRDLHDLRRNMRLKSNMLSVLRLGLLRIDAIFWKGVDNVLRLKPHVQEALKTSLDLCTG